MSLGNLQSIRQIYAKGELLELAIPPSPWLLFEAWFAAHQQSLPPSPAYPEPNAVVLSTCDKETLKPSARVVLLKQFDARGLVFFTNYDSRKGREIAGNPQASMTFYWDERQIRVEGTVVKVSAEESDEYYLSRPHKSKLGAWVSKQSQQVSSREVLDAEFAKIEARFESEPLTRPPFWGFID